MFLTLSSCSPSFHLQSGSQNPLSNNGRLLAREEMETSVFFGGRGVVSLGLDDGNLMSLGQAKGQQEDEIRDGGSGKVRRIAIYMR